MPAWALVDEHRRVALQRLGLVGVERRDQRLADRGRRPRRRSPAPHPRASRHRGHDSGLGDVRRHSGGRSRRWSRTRSRYQRPSASRSPASSRHRQSCGSLSSVGAIATERLVDQQVADRDLVAVDRGGARRGDADVGDVGDVGLGRVDLRRRRRRCRAHRPCRGSPSCRRSPGASGCRRGRSAADASCRARRAAADRRHPARPPCASESINRVPTSVGLAAPPSSPATILLTANPPAPSERDDGDQSTDDLAVAALPDGVGRHDGRGRLRRRAAVKRGQAERSRLAAEHCGGGSEAGGPRWRQRDVAAGRGGSNEMPSSLVSTEGALSPQSGHPTVSARNGST